jgi:DNA invertase Pin-like site-specific DNA recombinase
LVTKESTIHPNHVFALQQLTLRNADLSSPAVRLGIKYNSSTEQWIDSCGMFADAIVSIMATVAQQERIRISDRTKPGLERVRAKGVKLGRPMKDGPVHQTTQWRRAKLQRH